MKKMKVMYSITKEVRFSAGHFLRDVPEGHPCANPHGHNYKIFITLQSMELDKAGFILDFGIIKQAIKDRYDHITLNDVMEANPTAENIARDILYTINHVIFSLQVEDDVSVAKVTVWETETGSATVRPVVVDEAE